MKNIFEFKRFSNLLRLLFVGHAQIIGLYFILSFLILVLVLNLAIFNLDFYEQIRKVILLGYLIANFGIVGSVTGQDFRRKNTLSNFILTPNSVVEKTLMFVFVYGLLIAIISSLLFLLADSLVVSEFIPRFEFKDVLDDRFTTTVVSKIPLDGQFLDVVSLAMFFYYSSSVVVFMENRNKKMFVGIMIIPVLIVFAIVLNYLFFSDVPIKSYTSGIIGHTMVKDNSRDWGTHFYKLKSNISDMCFYLLVWFPLCVMGILIYYFKLKEREI